MLMHDLWGDMPRWKNLCLVGLFLCLWRKGEQMSEGLFFLGLDTHVRGIFERLMFWFSHPFVLELLRDSQ